MPIFVLSIPSMKEQRKKVVEDHPYGTPTPINIQVSVSLAFLNRDLGKKIPFPAVVMAGVKGWSWAQLLVALMFASFNFFFTPKCDFIP